MIDPSSPNSLLNWSTLGQTLYNTLPKATSVSKYSGLLERRLGYWSRGHGKSLEPEQRPGYEGHVIGEKDSNNLSHGRFRRTLPPEVAVGSVRAF